MIFLVITAPDGSARAAAAFSQRPLQRVGHRLGLLDVAVDDCAALERLDRIALQAHRSALPFFQLDDLDARCAQVDADERRSSTAKQTRWTHRHGTPRLRKILNI